MGKNIGSFQPSQNPHVLGEKERKVDVVDFLLIFLGLGFCIPFKKALKETQKGNKEGGESSQ